MTNLELVQTCVAGIEPILAKADAMLADLSKVTILEIIEIVVELSALQKSVANPPTVVEPLPVPPLETPSPDPVPPAAPAQAFAV